MGRAPALPLALAAHDRKVLSSTFLEMERTAVLRASTPRSAPPTLVVVCPSRSISQSVPTSFERSNTHKHSLLTWTSSPVKFNLKPCGPSGQLLSSPLNWKLLCNYPEPLRDIEVAQPWSSRRSNPSIRRNRLPLLPSPRPRHSKDHSDPALRAQTESH